MKEAQVSRRVDRSELESFAQNVLEAAGVAEEHIRPIARGLVEADLRGVDSHGVARLETYVKKFEGGGFNSDPHVDVVAVSDSVALVDGDDGPGHAVGITAMEEAMALASETGIGTSFVANSNHFGTAAFFTQRAAESGYIGIASSNVGPDVIPFGGKRAFLGTNPIAVSVPTDRSFPITLDMATSTVAMGKIDHVASEEDMEIPPEWAVDEAGNPTTDPHAVAALRPLGGPKGYGLAVLVDVFCGLLSGAAVSPDIGDLYENFDEAMGLGHWFVAIDIAAITDPEAFRSSVGTYIERLKAEPTNDAVDEIMLPGEPEALTRQENERNGVPLSEATATSLDRLAEKYDLSPVQ